MKTQRQKGGHARAAKLSPEERRAIAQKAAKQRWKDSPPSPIAPKPSKALKSRRWTPSSMQEVEELCDRLALSFHLPREFYDPPAGMPPALVATLDLMKVAAARALYVVQLGAEVGLPPAQALASISLRYGKPTLGGDAQLALVLDSGKAEHVREYTEGEMYIDGQVNMQHAAICETLRCGDAEPHVARFTVKDAHDAELWNKAGSWKTHKGRMMKYRARSFCLRDKYPDVLKGLVHSSEEMEGEPLPSRAGTSDVAPHDGAAKLSGLLARKDLNNTL